MQYKHLRALAERPSRLLSAFVILLALAASLAAQAGTDVKASLDQPLFSLYLEEHTSDRSLFAGIRDAPRRARLEEQLAELYAGRDYALLWMDDGYVNEHATAWIEVLQEAAAHGLDPADYRAEELAEQVAAARGKPLTPRPQFALESALTASYLAFGTDLCCGRIDPSEISAEWHLPRTRVNVAALADEVADGKIEDVVAKLTPPHEGYRQLVDALARYRELAASEQWQPLEAADTVEPGQTMAPELARRLVARLRAEGDLPPNIANVLQQKWSASSEPIEPTYGSALSGAVERFQARHGLEVDGKLGPKTLEALNAPLGDRLARIVLNLERWRWVPRDLGERHILVNVAAFDLEAFDAEGVTLRMPVVVGKNSSPTPLFADQMTYVELNPYWNVPDSIAVNELVRDARQERKYMRKNSYELVDKETGEVVPAKRARLSEVGERLRIRQQPGAGNALGRIKFMFPNQFNVYLHDTPSRAAFDSDSRALSHGCVRVGEPLALAEWVLQHEGEPWSQERVQREIDSRQSKQIDLTEPVPVYMLYWTAFLDRNGSMNFRDDLYGHDETMRQLLARAR